MVEAWTPILMDDDAQLINDALTVYVKTDRSGFAPTVGQLHGLIADASNKNMSDGEALHLLTLASRNSNYGAEEEFNKMPPLLQKAVGSPSVIKDWGNQTTDQLEYTFNRILKSYNELVRREKFDVASSGLSIGMMQQNLLEVR